MTLRPAFQASAATAAAGCSACRLPISRLLTPSTPSPFPSLPLARFSISTISSSHLNVSRRLAKPYSTQKYPSAENSASLSGAESTTTVASSESQARDEAAAEDAEEPWYLQEEPPRHPTLVPELHPLPEIPKRSPAILKDLVKFVAEDMGLDNLNLMDLRTLDPPPALGPSLIMLFGTARSDRHLHVSARSLQSWLRKHGIHAHADGLLGRNEFKIKMRRRQRKAKLLGTSATALGGDDGISTGWICVNLGSIGSPVHEEMVLETDGKFAGFGARQTGVTTIVVQLMTESKRRDLDLETLWSRILARTGNPNLVEDDLEYVEAETDPNEMPIFSEGGSPKVFATPSQRRFMSTSSRRHSPPGRSEQVNDPSTSTPAAGKVDTSLDYVRHINDQVTELERLQAEFASLSFADASEVLVSLAEHDSASKFALRWRNAMRSLPPEQSWRFRLWVCIAGRNRNPGLPGFNLSELRKLVQEMELIGIICQRGQFLELLRSVFLQSANEDEPMDELSALGTEILKIMFERGEPIVTTDVVVSLIESVVRAERQGPDRRELQAILEKFLMQADLPYMGETALHRLLDAYASQDNWERWWDMWRMPPKHQQPRSSRLYVHLWSTMEATKDQKRCREAIRYCFHEMLNEDPRVNAIGPVKEALEACIRVADPAAEEIAKSLRVTDARTQHISLLEFVHLFRQLNPRWAAGSS